MFKMSQWIVSIIKKTGYDEEKEMINNEVYGFKTCTQISLIFNYILTVSLVFNFMTLTYLTEKLQRGGCQGWLKIKYFSSITQSRC